MGPLPDQQKCSRSFSTSRTTPVPTVRPVTPTSRPPTSSSSPPARTRLPVTPTSRPPPPTPSPSTSKLYFRSLERNTEHDQNTSDSRTVDACPRFRQLFGGLPEPSLFV